MKSVHLRVEHRHGNRFLRQRHLRPDNRFYTVGSARDTDFRLLGADVQGIHAVIEYRRDGWYIIDVSALKNTIAENIKSQETVEHKIAAPMKFAIGSHTLDLRPCEVRKVLFQKEARDIDGAKSEPVLQQVVVRQNGHVVETFFLPPEALFEFKFGFKYERLPPPKTSQWVWHNFGHLTIQQRLVGVSRRPTARISPSEIVLPKDLRLSFVWAFLTMAILFVGFSLSHIGKKAEDETAKTLNPYLQMVYDAKVVQKKMAKSEKLSVKIMNRTAPPNSTSHKNVSHEVSAPKPSIKPVADKGIGAGLKAIKQIKTAHLTALVGRLTQRVGSTHLIQVATRGALETRSPSSTATSLAGLNKNILGGLKVNSAAESTQKILSIGTVGANSQNSYKNYGSIESGTVGSSQVGVIEEEADVAGGLDREVIAKQIQTDIGHIRYCYERRLSAKPDLYGKVKIQFMIGTNGAVTQSKIVASTLKDADVEGCILQRVSRWVFPRPKGGTTVLVSYPFWFKSTN